MEPVVSVEQFVAEKLKKSGCRSALELLALNYFIDFALEPMKLSDMEAKWNSYLERVMDALEGM